MLCIAHQLQSRAQEGFVQRLGELVSGHVELVLALNAVVSHHKDTGWRVYLLFATRSGFEKKGTSPLKPSQIAPRIFAT